MSTRALYTFRSDDGTEEYHVYKHSDGYPTGAADAICAALPFAWPLPRYEADEFAAAFVAANKAYWFHQEVAALRDLEAIGRRRQNGPAHYFADDLEAVKTGMANLDRAREYGERQGANGGGIRLCASGKFEDIAPQDLAYWYVIQPKRVKDRSASGASTMLDAQLIVTAYSVNHASETEFEEQSGGRYVRVPVPVERQGWKIKKLFVAPLKSGEALKAKAAAYEAKRG
jgi:hypothetical protein